MGDGGSLFKREDSFNLFHVLCFQTTTPPPTTKGMGMLMPYNFEYGIEDSDSGNQYSHRVDSDGQYVTGQYSVLLPDGRTQIVKFTSNPFDGYVAEVIYV